MSADRHLWWHLARASGVVSAVLVMLTVVWGLLMVTKVVHRRGIPVWLEALHRHLGALTVAFVGLHMAALAADSQLTFSWSDLLVPFASRWRPAATAAGVVAMWLLVTVQATSMLRRHMPRWLWRGVHMCSYVAVVAVVTHTVLAGSDVTNRALVAAGAALCTAVGLLAVLRAAGRAAPPPRQGGIRRDTESGRAVPSGDSGPTSRSGMPPAC